MKRLFAPLTLLVIATGCPGPECGLTGGELGNIAVAAGDFDDIADPLDRVPVDYETYSGIISVPTWDPEWEYDSTALQVEALLGDEADLFGYDSVLVASGVRGLGDTVYNGLEPDDQLLTDPVVAQNVRDFVGPEHRTLFVTDWAYDLIEAAWPDMIDFHGDDAVYDAAQVGVVSSETGSFSDEDLATALEADTLNLDFDYSDWALIESVHPDVRVWMTSDATLQTADGEGTEDVTAAPMLVSFTPAGAQGQVVFASFHVDAQNAEMMDRVLTAVVGEFNTDVTTAELCQQ